MIILPVPTKYGMQLINISTLSVLFIFFFILSASVHFTVVQQGTVFTPYGMADYVKTWIEGI
jgi:hypothetical protein